MPVTPEQIADSAIEAARAGAAIVHLHVRDPETGKGGRNPAHFREVVERIRASDVDPVLNLTAGMGGDLVLGGPESPYRPSRPEPTWREQPSGSPTSPSCGPRSARSTAGR